jgi:phosphoenolpyruvate-protein kinase (PTS system EI component)
MTRFTGLPVSEGTAEGALHVAADLPGLGDASATPEQVAAAFTAVAAGRSALAARLRAAGRGEEADIIEVGALIAADPVLSDPAIAAVRDGKDAITTIRESAERQAAVMAALPNRELAERAGDIRQVAQAVIERLAGAPAYPDGRFILVRQEISPAELIELADSSGSRLVGAVSVAGGASSHAAIIARGLGLPMIAGVDEAVLTVPSGVTGVLDADKGELIIGAARSAPLGPAPAPAPVADGPARTRDGTEIAILCNVASAAETRRGLAAGAIGVGLLRTEIPFGQATSWPSPAQHRAQLAPVLALLTGRIATVRLLDFSGDKIPPFLRGRPAGLTALLAEPGALSDQLRVVMEAGADTGLAVLIPMVTSLAQVEAVRASLTAVAAALGAGVPRLGIMVELRSTAARAREFAPAVDFFSIGTNDLTSDVLGLHRTDPAAGPALAAHPRVLALIERVTRAGRQAGIAVSVCGDSAADPLALPLLIGVGVRSLSVPAARVERVRSWVSGLDVAACAELAGRALRASTFEEVRRL